MGSYFEITYKKGRDNSAADALSRNPMLHMMQLQVLGSRLCRWNAFNKVGNKMQLLEPFNIFAATATIQISIHTIGRERRKGTLMMRADQDLRQHVIKEFHPNFIAGHSGVQATLNNSLWFFSTRHPRLLQEL